MFAIVSSPDSVLRNGVPDPALIGALNAIVAAGSTVVLISNQAEPAWFKPAFGAGHVQFSQSIGRQSGEVVRNNAARLQLASHDVFVLATKADDVQMGKNAQAVLVAGGWATSPAVDPLGIRVNTAAELLDTIALMQGWTGQWWFTGKAKNYNVQALCDLSSMYKSNDQVDFSRRVTAVVKNGGGARLMALLAITSRSLLMDQIDKVEDLLWGVYPSSKSANNDTEILSDFTHRLRTTVSRVRLAKRDVPLFIRHQASSKRSAGGGGDRTNPSEQIQTIHLNPEYQKNVKGRNVVVIDDCTTYGVSFGVAAAFLKKAGAASVLGLALGKFGSQLREYEIDILSDPFKPVGTEEFKVLASGLFTGSTSHISQQTLLNIFP